MRRIQFTRDELEIIADMCCIADATNWGEGDYQNWDRERAKPFKSLVAKLQTLIARADGLPNTFPEGKLR